MTIFFTADNHFGHTNIIEYCQRPFKTVEEMDKVMIENWNNIVTPVDTVFHLGDFTLGGIITAQRYLSNLNGNIFMLSNPWHHDKHWLKSTLNDKWSEIWLHKIQFLAPIHVYENIPPIVLCHYPMAIWDRKHYGAWHLHGHSHGRYKGEGFIMDVGVDANNFTPVSLYEVKEYMENVNENS